MGTKSRMERKPKRTKRGESIMDSIYGKLEGASSKEKTRHITKTKKRSAKLAAL